MGTFTQCPTSVPFVKEVQHTIFTHQAYIKTFNLEIYLLMEFSFWQYHLGLKHLPPDPGGMLCLWFFLGGFGFCGEAVAG